MYHRSMSDRDPGADGARCTGIDVNHRAVLHVGARPDGDRVRVAAQHGGVPHTALRRDVHLAQDNRARRNEDVFVNPFWMKLVVHTLLLVIAQRCHSRA